MYLQSGAYLCYCCGHCKPQLAECFKEDETHVEKILNHRSAKGIRAAIANQEIYEYKDYYFKTLTFVVVFLQHYFNSSLHIYIYIHIQYIQSSSEYKKFQK